MEINGDENVSVKILVEASSKVYIELPVDSYFDISTDNMSLAESDEMIRNEIYLRYGFSPDDIKVIKEVK